MSNATVRKLVSADRRRTWTTVAVLGLLGAASIVAGLVAMPRSRDMWIPIILGAVCLGVAAFVTRQQLALGPLAERIEALMANPRDIVWIDEHGMATGGSRLYSVIVCSRQGERLSLATGTAALRDQYLAELQAVAGHAFLPYTRERERSFRDDPASPLA